MNSDENNTLTIDPENTTVEQGYILEGREFRLTSRKAVQKLRSGKFEILYEIQPLSVYTTSPTNKNYNRWVTKKQLNPIVSDEILKKFNIKDE